MQVELDARRRRSTLAAQLPVAPLRLDLPVRADVARLPAAAGHHEPGPVPRHPVVPAAADLAPRLPQLRHVRGAGDEPVGRGGARRRRRALVRDPAHRAAPTRSTSRARTPRRRRPPLDGQRSPRTRRATWRSATASSTASTCIPGIRYTGRLAGDPLGQMTLGEGIDHQRHGRSDDDELPLGRLHLDEHRPRRRLHVLVRQRVLRGKRAAASPPASGNAIAPARNDGALADTHRQFQVAGLPVGGVRTTTHPTAARE